MSDTQDPNQAIDQEREQLKRDVLEELRKDTLKKEIIKELALQTRKNVVANLLRHPVFLLLLGLLMTGVIGAGLTSYWQNKQWDYQQKRLAQIRDIEQKTKQRNDTKDQIKKDFEAILSADTNVLYPAFNERIKDILGEIKRWEEAEKQWRSNASLLKQTLAIDFSNQTIQGAFDELITSQSNAARAIFNLKEYLGAGIGHLALDTKAKKSNKVPATYRLRLGRRVNISARFYVFW